MMDPENTLGNQMPGAGWEPSVANCYCKVWETIWHLEIIRFTNISFIKK